MKVTFNPDTHQYFDREGKELPSVTFLIKYFGLISFDTTPTLALERGRNFGKVVHATTALYDRKNLGSCDSAVESYLEGWKKFLRDYGSGWNLIEKPLGSSIWRFAGTPDRYRKSDGLLLDVKTGEEQPATDVQLSGYELLILENIKGARVREAWTVRLFQNNYKIIPSQDRLKNLSLFKSAAQLYGWKKQKGLIK